MSTESKLPTSEAEDHLQAVVKTIISAVPVIGSPAVEIFNHLITPPLVRRREAFVQGLADGLVDLEKKFHGFTIEALANREEFISAALHAGQAAIRTHQKEKLEALRNAVLNVAIGSTPDEDEQATFFEYIEALTPWHLRLLRFLQEPAGAYAESMNKGQYATIGGIGSLIEETYPELRGKRDLYDQLVRDLRARGLSTANDSTLHTMMTNQGVLSKRTTETGDRFLTFITAPRGQEVGNG